MSPSAAIYFLYKTATSTSAKAKLPFILTTSITAIASLAYLIMALGGSAIAVTNGRAFLWVRYADWAATTPLLLLDLGLLAGASYLDISWVVLCDLLMIAAGFAGAVSSGYNAAWPLFAFGMAVFVPVLYALAVTFPAAARLRGPKTTSLFNKLALIMAVTWSAYPLIWATGEGAQIMSVDQETIAYAAMDITAKCIFGLVLVGGHSDVEDESTIATTESKVELTQA